MSKADIERMLLLHQEDLPALYQNEMNLYPDGKDGKAINFQVELKKCVGNALRIQALLTSLVL